jgi:hypothetical protein
LRAAFAVLALAAFLAFAEPAGAKSFILSAAHVRVTVAPDGALVVEEEISFVYDGSFSGGFREIPLREGEEITEVFVAEGGTRYSPGAPTEIGSSGEPATFGVARVEDGVRVVWHYRAFSELRTFTIGYTLRGLAVAYDDVVDVNLKVWGDEWEVPLGTLTAELVLPAPASGRAYRAWGRSSSTPIASLRTSSSSFASSSPHRSLPPLPRRSAGAEARSTASSRRSSRMQRSSSGTRSASAARSATSRGRSSSSSWPLSAPRPRRWVPRTGSSAASGGPATTASTSRNLRRR